MKKTLHRRDVVNHILHQRGDLLVVAGLGAPAWDVTATGDHPLSFPLWGAMGGAAMIGLGLALAQPKRKVLVVTGDGEMLMGRAPCARRASSMRCHLILLALPRHAPSRALCHTFRRLQPRSRKCNGAGMV